MLSELFVFYNGARKLVLQARHVGFLPTMLSGFRLALYSRRKRKRASIKTPVFKSVRACIN